MTQGEETKQLIDWLSPLQYSQKHEISSDIRQPETGTWLFEHELFKEWENATASKLWIWGNPGTGKTILACVSGWSDYCVVLMQ